MRAALSVRQNTNDEIVYIESGKYPLHCRIKKQQLKFWLYILKYTSDNPNSSLNKILSKANELGISYIRYYKKLHELFIDPVNCEYQLRLIQEEKWKRKINAAYITDLDSKLGTYFRINPSLTRFVDHTGTENERILITRFRTGSHSLNIELGRFSNVPRGNRLCICKGNVQTIQHIFTECILTNHLIGREYQSLAEIFEDPELPRLILSIVKVLKIPTR